MLKDIGGIENLAGLNKNISKKLAEIKGILGSIPDIHELKRYWESIKWYLQANRKYFGSEYEFTIARKFDQANNRIAGKQPDDGRHTSSPHPEN